MARCPEGGCLSGAGAICLGRHPDFPHFCAWAQRSERHRRHVLDRSRIAGGLPPLPPLPRPPAPRFAPERCGPRRDPCIAREVVVAAYREDLDWLRAVPYPVAVYHHGGPGACPEDYHCVRLPNLGREAHCYLNHIVINYDDLAAETVFCQGDPFPHSPDFLDRVSLRSDRPTTLTTMYTAEEPHASIKALDRVERVGGYWVRYGLATGDHLDRKAPTRPWLNPAIWSHVFACPAPDPWWFGYAATWLVSRDAIRARPPAFWRWLLGEVERAGEAENSWTEPPTSAWMLEAIWLYLFSDPDVYPHRTDILGAPAPTATATAEPAAMVSPLNAEEESLFARMLACPHRDLEGCGCAGARCKMGKGKRGIVRHDDCFKCLSEV